MYVCMKNIYVCVRARKCVCACACMYMYVCMYAWYFGPLIVFYAQISDINVLLTDVTNSAGSTLH
jgi:hypothetical protein